MCTMIVAPNYFAQTPLLVAGNRDEWLNRPSAPPEYKLLEAASRIPILAPLDLKARGTWLGLSALGVFVGITNRFGQPPDPNRRSRGELVLQALSCRSAIEAFDLMKNTNPGAYNRFHLVMADREKAFLLWSDGERLHTSELAPGIHVVTERSFAPTISVRAEKLRTKLLQLSREKAPDEAVLHEMLAQHDDADPFNGTCVHVPGQVYGTRSSTLIWLFADGTNRFLHAEGPPCQSTYQDYSSQAVFTEKH
jgi:uncharacterized protein with NRDE domain